MDKAPTISILVPVYNAAPFLERCLNSLLGQSLAEIEVVAVDDGSEDASPAILRRYAEADKRVKVVTHPDNQGTHRTRLDGFRNASGRYIGYADPDDWVEPETFATALRLLEQHQADTLRFSYRRIDPDGNDLPRTPGEPVKTEVYSSGREYLRRQFHSTMWSHLHKRELWETALPFFPDVELSYAEDNLTSFVLAYLSRRFVCVPDALYCYYIHPASAMQIGTLDNCIRQINYRRLVIDLLHTFLEAKNDVAFLPYRKVVIANYNCILGRLLPRLQEADRAKASVHFLDRFGELISEHADQVVNELQQTQGGLNALYNSVWWKITSPPRNGIAFLKKSFARQ